MKNAIDFFLVRTLGKTKFFQNNTFLIDHNVDTIFEQRSSDSHMMLAVCCTLPAVL